MDMPRPGKPELGFRIGEAAKRDGLFSFASISLPTHIDSRLGRNSSIICVWQHSGWKMRHRQPANAGTRAPKLRSNVVICTRLHPSTLVVRRFPTTSVSRN